MDHLCYFCILFVMLSHLLIAALWSPVERGLTSWLLFVVLIFMVVTFPFGILGQVCLQLQNGLQLQKNKQKYAKRSIHSLICILNYMMQLDHN